MATCLILMFGRVGGVGGSNFVALLLNVDCELIFYLYSGMILSKFQFQFHFRNAILMLLLIALKQVASSYVTS